MSAEPEQLSLDVAGAPEPEPEAASPDPEVKSLPPAAVPPPTSEQAAAIDSRDRDIFLEAGAGTGKTRVLVERYCNAVDVDGIEPERILAFTFTEKAAAEMRRRVRVELLRRSREAGDADPERRRRLQRAARAGETAPITTIHGFCRRLLAANPVAAGLDPGFRVLDADEAARLAAIAFEEALDELAGRDDAVAMIAAAFRGRRLRGLIRGAYDDLRNHGERSPDLPPMQITAFEGKKKGKEESIPDASDLEVAEASYGAIRELLVAYGERYAAIKAERSGVDFDDLQLLSLQLLEDAEPVARAQRERFDHLLVDEFQDTSPLQIGLVSALRGPECRLFSVGDEFQSIYAFRGADLDSFRRQRSEAGASVLALSGSFRSTPPIVAAVNAIGGILLDDFNELRVGRLPGPDAPGTEPGSEPAVELLLTKYEGWKKDGPELTTSAVETSPDRIAEARYLAARLREHADAGVRPGSMVLLLRAFSHIDAYVEALERAGLDPYVVGGRGYWSSQQVEDALKLLACVANPLDDEALFGALASPAAAAGPDTLWLLRQAAGRGQHVWPALRETLLDEDSENAQAIEAVAAIESTEREAVAGFARTLMDLRAGAAQMALDTLVERTLEEFGYDLAALSLSGGRRRAANLLKLVRMAGEYEAHEGRDLRGFLDWVAARAALSDREAEAATAAEDHDGITVMTIHAAKGLEFDCVAVGDLGRAHRTGTPPDLPVSFGEGDAPQVGLRLARAGAAPLTVDGWGAITDAASAADAEETGRLIYVAASRARERLILSGTYKEKEMGEDEREHPASDSTIRRLLPGLGIAADDAGREVEVAAPEPRGDLPAEFGPGRIRVAFNRAEDPAAARLAEDHRARTPDPGPAPGGTPPMTVLAERGASAARSLSYAALSEYSRCGYRFLTERVIGLGGGIAAATGSGNGEGGDEVRARLGFGRAVHELLEASGRAAWRPPAEEEIAAALRRQGAVPGRAGEAAELVRNWLGSQFLAGLRDAGAAFRPELGFRLRLDAAGGETLLRGTIDLLAEVEGEPPVVIDFKTDRALPVADRLPEAYEIQRDLYAAAIAADSGAESVRTAYVFLRSPVEPIVDSFGLEQIAAGRARIEALVGQIRERRFEPTNQPHRGLCHDCPARTRLCPHPLEMTGAEHPPA